MKTGQGKWSGSGIPAKSQAPTPLGENTNHSRPSPGERRTASFLDGMNDKKSYMPGPAGDSKRHRRLSLCHHLPQWFSIEGTNHNYLELGSPSKVYRSHSLPQTSCVTSEYRLWHRSFSNSYPSDPGTQLRISATDSKIKLLSHLQILGGKQVERSKAGNFFYS